MKTTIGLVLGTVMGLACGTAQASTKLGQSATDPLGMALLPVSSMHDMQGGRWTVSVAPGLWTVGGIAPDTCRHSCGSGDYTFPFKINGKLFGLGLKREFSPKWGAGVVFAWSKQGGSVDLGAQDSGLAPASALAGTAGSAGFGGGTFENFGGYVFGAFVTHDFFDNPDGFRLPVSIGPMIAKQSLDFKHTFTNPNNSLAQTESVEWRRTFTGALINVSFDFLFFKNLRVMPGIMGAFGFTSGAESDFDYVVTQAGTSTAYKHSLTASPESGTLYVQFLWRPWNLGTTFNFQPGNEDTRAFTLQWHRSFGS